MELQDAIFKRRSERSYNDTPVVKELMQSIFSAAQQAPSNCNSQSWHVVVVSGEVRDVVATYEIVGVPEDRCVLFNLSFAYAKNKAPINHYHVGRVKLDSSVVFLG